MSGNSIDDPQHWRFRAEEMRTLAEDMKDQIAREMMLRMRTIMTSLRSAPKRDAARTFRTEQCRMVSVVTFWSYRFGGGTAWQGGQSRQLHDRRSEQLAVPFAEPAAFPWCLAGTPSPP
jgi:hypothetical protein